MTNINNNLPYSYLNVLNPTLGTTASTTAVTQPTATPPGTTGTGVTGANSGTPTLSSDVLALLQQLQPSSSGSSNSLASLLGGGADAAGVGSLLGNNSSSPVDALLGGNTTDPLSQLLGSNNTNSALDALLTNSENQLQAQFYASALNAAYSGAAQQTGHTTTPTNPLDALLAQYQAASTAYNQTLLLNAQNVLAQNSFGADGGTLV